MKKIIELRHLSKSFDGQLVLDDISLDIYDNEFLTLLGPSLAEVVISEGKFHQVKRMFSAVGHEVLQLHRCAFGPLELDPALAEGQWRELTEGELKALRQAAGMGDK